MISLSPKQIDDMTTSLILRASTFCLALFLSSAPPVNSSDCKLADASVLTTSTRGTLTTTAPSQPSLPEIAREVMQLHFRPSAQGSEIKDYIKNMQVRQEYRQRHGVFVTLSYKGKTRACWGSVFPQYDSLAKATVYATLGALTKEYRYKPVSPAEINRLKVQVTVIKDIEAVDDIRQVSPFRDGVMVRSGGKSGVILPGEASDAYYELVLAKLKAGINPGEPFQLYRLRADIHD